MAIRAFRSEGMVSGWRSELSHAVKGFDELKGLFPFSESEEKEIRAVCENYPPFIPPFFLSLIERVDPTDPIRLQVVPSPMELRDPGMEDPLAEDRYSPFPGAVHRYENRLLLVTTNRCAVHCRYCFRKRNWNSSPFIFSHWTELEGYLRTHPQVEDLLISGGDPLLLPDAMLDRLLSLARSIESLKVVRIGTRVPVVLPSRINRGLLKVLEVHAPLWICLHVNHPKELTDELYNSVMKLSRAGCAVVSQTVLLRGVNDSTETLATLFMGLLSLGVKPYYIFQCDPAPGTAHFRVGIEEGRQIVKALWGKVSGLAYPHYAMDLPGGGGKVLL